VNGRASLFGIGSEQGIIGSKKRDLKSERKEEGNCF
jgi:hypothetical protein